MQIRDRYRLQQWTQIIQQCKSSRLTNKVFYAQNGISEKTYYYWLKKMRIAIITYSICSTVCDFTESGTFSIEQLLLIRSYWITAKSGKNLRTAKQPEHPRKKSAQKCSQAVGGVHGQHNQSRLGFCRATQVCQYSV